MSEEQLNEALCASFLFLFFYFFCKYTANAYRKNGLLSVESEKLEPFSNATPKVLTIHNIWAAVMNFILWYLDILYLVFA